MASRWWRLHVAGFILLVLLLGGAGFLCGAAVASSAVRDRANFAHSRAVSELTLSAIGAAEAGAPLPEGVVWDEGCAAGGRGMGSVTEWAGGRVFSQSIAATKGMCAAVNATAWVAVTLSSSSPYFVSTGGAQSASAAGLVVGVLLAVSSALGWVVAAAFRDAPGLLGGGRPGTSGFSGKVASVVDDAVGPPTPLARVGDDVRQRLQRAKAAEKIVAGLFPAQALHPGGSGVLAPQTVLATPRPPPHPTSSLRGTC
mgnify:CR=1 FL=1